MFKITKKTLDCDHTQGKVVLGRQSEDDFKGMLKTRLEHAKKFFKKDKIYVFDHQECHAYHALSFDRKKNEKKLIFSIDGGGDGANAACWILDPKKNNLITVARTNKFHIGRLYRYITLMLGMLPVHHEYKVMGLAPYANKNYAKKITEGQKVNGFFFQ